MSLLFFAGGVLSALDNAYLQVKFNSTQTLPVYLNGQLQKAFNPFQSCNYCVGPALYLYNQTLQMLQTNQPYYLVLQGSGSVTDIELTTEFKNPMPSISVSQCTLPCNLTITNNCNALAADENQIQISFFVNGSFYPMGYYIDCDGNYLPSQFTLGLFLIIMMTVLFQVLIVNYTRAWSFGGFGISVGWWILVFLLVAIIAGGLIIFFQAVIALDVFNWILSILSVAFCASESLYLIRLEWLRKELVWRVRLQDLLSLSVGVGVTLGWWFSLMAWGLNDLISFCFMVAVIKLFKFNSMCWAASFMMVLFVVEVSFTLAIKFGLKLSYSNYFLSSLNTPLEIQLPILTQTVQPQCAWAPATTVCVCGMFLAYLKRFDMSRNSYVYTLSALLAYLVGSAVWLLVSSINIHSVPLAIFVYPTMILPIFMMSFCRRQNRTIWQGSFYDEQFFNKNDVIQFQAEAAQHHELEQIILQIDKNQILFEGINKTPEQALLAKQ